MDKIRVIVCEPYTRAYTKVIDNTLEAMQSVVGGLIECISIGNNVDIVCNGEGKNNKLPLNRALYDEDGEMYEIIAGTFFIAEINSNRERVSLSNENLQKYKKIYYFGHEFFYQNGKIVALCNNIPYRFPKLIKIKVEGKVKSVVLVPETYCDSKTIIIGAFDVIDGHISRAHDYVTISVPETQKEIYQGKDKTFALINCNKVDWLKVLLPLGIIEQTEEQIIIEDKKYQAVYFSEEKLFEYCGDLYMDIYNEVIYD